MSASQPEWLIIEWVRVFHGLIQQQPYLSLVALYVLWILIIVALFLLRPLTLLRIHNALEPFEIKLPAWLGGITLPARALLAISGFAQTHRVLDAWVERHIAAAWENFEQRQTVRERVIHVPLPAIIDSKLVTELTPSDLRPAFRMAPTYVLYLEKVDQERQALDASLRAGRWPRTAMSDFATIE